MSLSSAIPLKCCVVGDGAVGKSCLLICYTRGEFPTEYVPTVFDNHNAVVMCADKVVDFVLWDTAGQEDYDRLRPLSYPGTDVFLCCFSVINPDSFENVKERWVPELRHCCAEETPILLVGCKTDLREDGAVKRALAKRAQSVLRPADGVRMAKECGLLEYVECSARTMEGVNHVFDRCIRAHLFKPKKKSGKGKCKLL